MSQQPRPVATLRAWKKAVADRLHAEQLLAAATRAIEISDELHREKHPLSDEVRACILKAYCEGKPLCCTGGRASLKELGLDECWVEHLSDWAYERLGCSPEHKPGGRYFESGKAKLREKLGYTKEIEA